MNAYEVICKDVFGYTKSTLVLAQDVASATQKFKDKRKNSGRKIQKVELVNSDVIR